MADAVFDELPTKPMSVRHATVIRYVQNLPFAKYFDPKKNTKFPGPQVNALMREDLPYIQGTTPPHVEYEPEVMKKWSETCDEIAIPSRFPPYFYKKKEEDVEPKHAIVVTETEVDPDNIGFRLEFYDIRHFGNYTNRMLL